jgi:hypothetical protein
MALLRALPELILLLRELMTWLNRVSGNDVQGFLTQLSDAMAELNKAKTVEERQHVAETFARIIHNLH